MHAHAHTHTHTHAHTHPLQLILFIAESLECNKEDCEALIHMLKIFLNQLMLNREVYTTCVEEPVSHILYGWQPSVKCFRELGKLAFREKTLTHELRFPLLSAHNECFRG